MDLYEVAQQHREEMVREAEMNRLTKRLRVARKRRAGMNHTLILIWELERSAGRLLKLLRAPKIPLLALACVDLWRKS